MCKQTVYHISVLHEVSEKTHINKHPYVECEDIK